ncbi:MAG: hypothetical protein ACLGIS_17170 [Actinomycetes bacterium]
MRLTMDRPLPRPLGVTWRPVLIGAYIIANLAMVLLTARPSIEQPDWALWSALRPAIEAGHMYDTGPTEAHFAWSPVAGYVMAGVAEWVGYWPWLILHVAAVLLLLNDRLLTLLVLVSWGFWIDAVAGNTYTFSFVAGALALRANRPAALVYMALLFLMPRPILLPLAAWIVWRMPEIRWPAAALFVMHGLVVLASGYAVEWMMSARATTDIVGNYGPTYVFGWAWLVVGIPLGVWLALRGHLGWAGVAVSPYLLPAYWLTPLWELSHSPGNTRGGRLHLHRR